MDEYFSIRRRQPASPSPSQSTRSSASSDHHQARWEAGSGGRRRLPPSFWEILAQGAEER